MAINLVIKVDEDFNPNHNNIIVYDEKEKIWKPVTKEFFLKEVNERFKNQLEENRAVAEKIEKLNNKISKLAEILKGELS